MIASNYENCSTCFVYLAQTIDPVASRVVGVASQAATSSAVAVSTVLLLSSQGAGASFTSLMTLNSRIALMKFININFPNPLASFFEYVDFKQFGLPNVFKSILNAGSNTPPDAEGLNVLYNQYWNYTYNMLFFDNCGGIISATFQFLALYTIFKILFKIVPEKQQKLKHYLNLINGHIEKRLLAIFVSSRLLQLYFGIILNFRYMNLGNLYRDVSFAFCLLYAVVLIALVVICYAGSFRQKRSETRGLIQPLAMAVKSLCFQYTSSSSVGRFMPMITLFLSNFFITIAIALLTSWILLQLMIISMVHILTICLSFLPKIFKRPIEKIQAIVTTSGTLLFCWVLALIHLTDPSSISKRRILAWIAVAIALFLMIFEILIKLIDVFLERRRKKRLAARKKRRLAARDQRDLVVMNSTKGNSSTSNQGRMGRSRVPPFDGIDQSSRSMIVPENTVDRSPDGLELRIQYLEKEN